MNKKTPWYRRIPYITEDRPPCYAIIPRKNGKRKHFCVPIRMAELKFYIRKDPNLTLAAASVGKDIEDVCELLILRSCS